jgi:plasmid stability protein
MATLTIRNVDEATHRGLRLRAAENGRSVEEEVRRILAEQAGSSAEYRNPKTPKEIDAAVKAAQKLFAPLRDRYSVDQFLEEKHEEAAREFADDRKPFKE